MNFKIVILFAVFVSITTLEVGALKRIKRNTALESKNSRIKQDFVALHRGKEVLTEKGNNSELKVSLNNSNNEMTKKRNVSSRPLAVILRERERKLNDRQRDNTAAEGNNSKPDSKMVKLAVENDLEKSTNVMDKRSETSGSDHKNFNANTLHTSSVVGAHVIIPPQPKQQSYGVLRPFASLDHLMKIGNMMMFKVGIDSLPYSPKMSMIPNLAPQQQQGNFIQQINEPDFDYIEGPQDEFFNEKAHIINNIPYNNNENGVIITKPLKLFTPNIADDNEPKDLVNLMQTALDTLLYNSNKNENESELKCPLHLEKKSLKKAGEDIDNANVIQVCSCRFIKRDKEQK
ncbi:uncharacterized protein LOC119605343 [Lucilia sericata]|uniref:uncharacterized protein LOC119605343 n=1 Tax=Lucilia sericata TaxID=13632 RepID=UPI0018A822D5|nr:uncharacterized protein LOC119605343 [Lucilia sericata]